MAAYRGWESLERRRLLTTIYDGETGFTYDGKVNIDDYTTVIDANIANPSPIAINGTSKADRILIYDDNGEIAVSVNRHVTRYSAFPAARPLVIDGRDGDDVISIELAAYAPFDASTVRGGEGNDSIFGSAAAERIFGGAGNDALNGGAGRDTLYGEAGDDSLRGDGGSDLIDGGAGYDTLRGDAGNDNLSGGDNPDRLRGGIGNDQLSGGGGRDILAGEDGDDSIYGDNGADSIYPGTGSNLIDARTDDYVDDGGVIKAGAGTLRLTNNSTYTGGTTLSGGKLDVNDNKLIVSNAVGSWNGSSYTGVTGLIASGRNGGSWGGTGITTGVATGTEVKSNTDTETGLWGGQTITGTDTLVMYTYGGDATLDGKLNIDDYVKIDSGIGLGLTGWSNGDFNYDGVVNIDDYTTVIDANIGNQGGGFFTGSGSGVSGVTAVTSSPIDITGTAKADRIIIYNDDNGQIAANVNGRVTRYAPGEVIIHANNGDDVISVELTGTLAATFVTIFGGAGNDSIYSGDTSDRIEAGEGDDLVFAGGGRNIVYGGAGSDSITGGNSTDHLDGEDGIDTLVGLRGDNFLTNGEVTS